jgi:hypothetical protein
MSSVPSSVTQDSSLRDEDGGGESTIVRFIFPGKPMYTHTHRIESRPLSPASSSHLSLDSDLYSNTHT